MVADAESPGYMVQGKGEMFRIKSGDAMVTATVVVSLRAPEVPVMVNTKLFPVVAELLALSVSELLLVVGFTPQLAVTPLGSAEVTARFTLLLNPA